MVNEENGLLCYISSNKWMRAKYGKNLRSFLSDKNPIKLINFGGHKVFEGPTVDVNILLVSNTSDNDDFEATKVGYNFENEEDLGDYFSQKSVSLSGLSKDTWFIGTKKEMELKHKIEEVGTPLEDWDVDISYGIKTGRNKVFIINEEKRNELIEKDPNSKEIIGPILRGRNIQRYGYEFNGEYIILAKFGAYKTLPTEYPAIYEYLKQYEKSLKERGQCNYSSNWSSKSNDDYPGQHHWLELDNNPTDEYLHKFEEEKIMWREMTSENAFFLDEDGYYCNDTARIMTGDNLKFLLGLLNSKLFHFVFGKFYSGGELGGKGIRYKHTFMNKVPLPEITEINNDILRKVEDFAIRIQRTNQKKGSDAKKLGSELDKEVYELYDLTPEEIKIVEDKST